MMCSKEKFDAIKPKLKSAGMFIDTVALFDSWQFLVNNYGDKMGVVSNVSKTMASDFSRSVFHEWDEEVFLRFCGIGTSSVDDTEQVDNVNNPKHYNLGKVECIDAIESATVGKVGIQAVCTANAIKYLWRFEEKGGLEDIKKAQWYLNKLIESYNV